MEAVKTKNCDQLDALPQPDHQSLELVSSKVFGNHLIFFKILRSLDHLDILECRKVSRLWYRFATEILDNDALQFEFCHSLGCFIRTIQKIRKTCPESKQDYLLPSCWSPSSSMEGGINGYGWKLVNGIQEYLSDSDKTFIEDQYTLHVFTKLVKECRGQLFKRLKLSFGDYNWWTRTREQSRKRDIEEFLSAHGSKVIELGQDLFNEDSLKFLTLLLRNMPNLEKLHIGIRVDSSNNRSPISPWLTFPESSIVLFAEEMSLINLPKLEALIWTIGYDHDFKSQSKNSNQLKDPWFAQFLGVIVNSAANLKRNVRLPWLRAIKGKDGVPTQKVSSVHKLTFKPNLENIDLYLKFANGEPQLSTITFDLEKTKEIISQDDRVGHTFEGQVKQCLRKILEGSKLTLNEVKGRRQMEGLDCLRELVPLLPQVIPGQNRIHVAPDFPLSNSIVMKILNNLPATFLLTNTRLVSRQWREISNQLLIQRRSVQISFVYNPQHSRYIRQHSSFNPTAGPEVVNSEFTEDLPTLHKLNDCLQQVGRFSLFPCARFRFSNFIINSQEINEFGSVYGSKVKELELNLDASNTVACFESILGVIKDHSTFQRRPVSILSDFPNLEVLTLARDSLDPKDRRRNEHDRLLHCAPTSPYSPFCKLISSIKPWIPSPDYFSKDKSFWISQLNDIICTRELKLEFRHVDLPTCTVDLWTLDPEVSSTHLEIKVPHADDLKMEVFLSRLEQLADFRPKLWSLNVDLKMCFENRQPEVNNRIRNAIKTILLENETSLTELQGLQHLQILDEPDNHFLSNLKFPNVRALTLSHGELTNAQLNRKSIIERHFPSLPRGYEGYTGFPCLKEVTLNFDDHEIFKQFSTTKGGFLRKVEKLTLLDSGDALWIQEMAKIFQKVTELVWVIKNPEKFTPTAPTIWESFKKVRTLTLDFHMDNVRLDNNNDPPSVFYLDGGFTGFTEAVCEQLQGAMKKLSDRDAEDLRSHSFIGSLYLHKFNLIFRDKTKGPKDLWTFMRSRVTGRYGFKHFHGAIWIQTTRELEEKYQEILEPFEHHFSGTIWQTIDGDISCSIRD